MNVEVALVDFWGPAVAFADALQIKLGVLEILSVDLPELQVVELGLEGNLHRRGFFVASPVLAPHAVIDTITSRQQLGCVTIG